MKIHNFMCVVIDVYITYRCSRDSLCNNTCTQCWKTVLSS